MPVENNTNVQLLRILYKNGGKKKRKIKRAYPSSYPRNLEEKYARYIKRCIIPLVQAVENYISENAKPLLRGDSLHLDVLPGGVFQNLISSMSGWLSLYMPTVEEMQAGQNNVVFMGLGENAELLKSFADNSFQKQLSEAIGVKFTPIGDWWNSTRDSWQLQNYNLIRSSASRYVDDINRIAEQAVINGWSVKHLTEELLKEGRSITEKKARLIARDQIGKLYGRIQQGQMTDAGLDLYIWETAGDERVRGTPGGRYPDSKPSHYVMDGLLCRWDDASVYSDDNGKTWKPRPFNSPMAHPGEEIQCRCIALVYVPELLTELEGENIEPTEKPPEPEIISSEKLTPYEQELYDDIYKNIKGFYELTDDDCIMIARALATSDLTTLYENFSKINELDYEIFLRVVSKNEFSKTKGIIQGNKLEYVRYLYEHNISGANLNGRISDKTFNEFFTWLKNNSEVIKSVENPDIPYDFIKLLKSKDYNTLQWLALAERLPEGSSIQKYINSKAFMSTSNEWNKELGDFLFYSLLQRDTPGAMDFSNLLPIHYLNDSLNNTNFILSSQIVHKASGKYMGYLEFVNNYFPSIIGIQPSEASPWGTAEKGNDNFYAIAMFDHKAKTFNKKQQKLVSHKEIVLNPNTIRVGISQKMYAEELMKNSLSFNMQEMFYNGKKWRYATNEFMRLEFSWNNTKKDYKVGDILEQTGAFAMTPSELHNALWYNSKLEQGARSPVRFHLQNNTKTRKYASAIIVDDLGREKTDWLNPEEIDFSISKIKVTRVYDGFINNDKNYPVKEVDIEIVE